MEKFGQNGEQVERFIEAAADIQFDSVEPIYLETRSPGDRVARDKVLDVQFSAARHAAIESAVRKLISDLRHRFPLPGSTGERVIMNGFSETVRSAVFALAARPVLDDTTVGTLVDPFASRLNFEWRSWGVSMKRDEEGDLG